MPLNDVTFEEINESEFGGYLFKRGRGKTFSFSKPWSMRYVVVNRKAMNISHYEERAKHREGYSSKDLLSLEGAQISELPQSDSGKEFSFQVTVLPGQSNEVCLVYSTLTETFYNHWLDALRGLATTARATSAAVQGGVGVVIHIYSI